MICGPTWLKNLKDFADVKGKKKREIETLVPETIFGKNSTFSPCIF